MDINEYYHKHIRSHKLHDNDRIISDILWKRINNYLLSRGTRLPDPFRHPECQCISQRWRWWWPTYVLTIDTTTETISFFQTSIRSNDPSPVHLVVHALNSQSLHGARNRKCFSASKISARNGTSNCENYGEGPFELQKQTCFILVRQTCAVTNR